MKLKFKLDSIFNQ